MDTTTSREEFEKWISKWAGVSKEAITALRNPDESDIDTYISDVIDDEALQFFIVGYAAWQAGRESIEVVIPPFDGYKDHVAKELQEALKIALRTAGIRIKGESE